MTETGTPIDYAKRPTAKQLGMVRRACNVRGKDADIESIKRFNCLAGEMTKQQAADLIQEMETK